MPKLFTPGTQVVIAVCTLASFSCFFNMEISLQEAFAGKNAQVRIPTSVTCESCSGTGAKPGTKPELPELRRLRQSPSRSRLLHARAHLFDVPGPRSGDRKPLRIVRRIGPGYARAHSVGDIPPGVEDGTRIRLAGEGEAGVRGGPAGDLYIFLSMAAHPFFQRDGADLHCRMPVSMVAAALGADFEVPTIDGGKTRVKVPEGTQSGRRLRLQGKGMPVLRTRQTGDMYVQVMVETPQN